MNEHVTFPVIAIGKGQVLFFARNAEDLTTCSAKGFNNGYYNNLKIIDSKGKRLLVNKAEKIGTVGLFWGYSFTMGQRLRVKLHFNSKEEVVSLEEFKVIILSALNKDRYFWNSDGQFEDRQNFIQNARSHSEIIARMTDEFYKKYKI